MLPQPERPADACFSIRTGRVTFWIIFALAVATIGGAVLYYVNRAKFDADERLLAELGITSLFSPEAQSSGDWPQCRGPNRDGVSGETGLLTEWPAGGPKLLWEAACGPGYSSFAKVGKRVLTMMRDGADEAAVCWDADTGQEFWRFHYACSYNSDQGNGPRSTPTVDGDLVYTVGATGVFHCLKLESGEKVWRHDLLQEFGAPNLQWGVSFSPLVEGSVVFTNPGGPNGNSIAAFDKIDGTPLRTGFDDPAGYSSPMRMTLRGRPVYVFFTGAALIGIWSSDGTELWRYPWDTAYRANIATPIIVGNYIFISSGYGKGCALLKIEETDKGFAAKRVYESNQMRNHFSSSVYFKEHLYGFDEDRLICMEFRTGKVRWKERGFKKGSLLIADGHLIVLGEYGELAVAEATPDGFRPKSSCRISKTKCWTVPVFADGKLYVRDEEKVRCLDLKKR